MDILQVATAETRIKKVLKGLGFSEGLGSEGVDAVNMMEMPTRLLSGGWVMRASLVSSGFLLWFTHTSVAISTVGILCYLLEMLVLVSTGRCYLHQP